MINYSRLYLFNDETETNYIRHSFQVNNKKSLKGLDDLFQKEKSSIKSNDYFVYLKWQEMWFLRRFIDSDQFTIEIPKIYSEWFVSL